MKPLFRLMTELSSRKWVSRLTGSFAKSKVSKLMIPRFAKIYGIPVEDAEKEIHEYESLNAFFTRKLKPGLRPLDPDPKSMLSPVDAMITGMGPIKSGQILNVKGQDYTIEDLLNRSPRTMNYTHGFFFVLYLSPTDYHRIHSPVTGTILEKEHVAGKVYPVNEFGLRNMKKVLSRNERLITIMQTEAGEVAVVKVGALNVSSIQYISPLPDRLQRGDDLAYFEFGSTVVLLTENNIFEPRTDLEIGSKVKMGEYLGHFVK
ncbi:archaetidylserine decarboxylase [Paenibacillus larvae]|uniref:Phosphatidylserine decarboxylase proenzyme n=5 Tax=Paenibacillus larvae TaxID=1464 RepID=V9W9Z0_9BACL|nr:archaetidylserine decarboxylase [Paenibacillus larvae]AHD06699.1 phosphatidylserine decarboxylase proenzyme Psd [Paenibacillus larvae subsp. larvae DSM 25430]AQR77756.1 phosphatidylserine decarboxylase [Paenibacillus larvae subsp. larvae]AQT84191.1 phosphatidylserine decarboxylase [Paenibacillus larvae subsp. pulvifaciens]AQZ46166.1 phosphatidylserine decarboxylase [Paenibacillus larvae subsp. pulvifaciens]ARF67504.1 phosphatidylserine decarboxylase [Paenibacillus larvae subsp. pulvifaciens